MRKRTCDIWIVPRNGEAEPFLRTRFNEAYPEFSPDGRWLVYTSDESGRDEVYVRPYPGPGRAMQISTAGGSSPGWSRDGSEVFYRWQERLLCRSDHNRWRESASGHTGEALRLELLAGRSLSVHGTWHRTGDSWSPGKRPTPTWT